MILRNLNVKSATRIGLGVLLIAVGFVRIVVGRSYASALTLLLNEYGLVILGTFLILGIFTKLNKTFFLLYGALLYGIAIEEGLLNRLQAQRLATVVLMGLFFWFLYKCGRMLFVDARRDSLERTKHRAYFGTIPENKLLDSDSPYRSHLENKEFLLRDMKKSKQNSLVGTEGCLGTRWHFGPLWFENFFGDKEPPFGKDGPLRVVIWQPVRDTRASKGWVNTKLLRYNHMTGFASLPTDGNYAVHWSDHARRQLKKWQAQTTWEIYHPTPQELFTAYRQCHQNVLLKFYFLNLTKQLIIHHGNDLIFWGVRKAGSTEPMVAGFVSHDIPEAKQSRHLMSFVLPKAKEDHTGIGLMDAWHQDAVRKGFTFLDFGVFWMEGDPESWKGFSRFKGQFNITYIHYPAARLRRAGSWKGLFRHAVL